MATILRRKAALRALALSTVSAGSPLTIAQQGWLFAGGHIDDSLPGHPTVGQLYAEYQIPAAQHTPTPSS